MVKFFLPSLLFVLFTFSKTIEAQPPSRGSGFVPPMISGKITDPNSEAVPFASIALFNAGDSVTIKGVTSDINGMFEIKVRPGTYDLLISFLSYKQKRIKSIEVRKEGKDIGTVAMELGAENIDEVEITAERSQMELKLDKRVFNVGKDLSNTGANAAEILDNVPSVSVDVEGNVSLRGSENVRVLINGKPSVITGGSTAEVLRQFQGNMIERVEVITNPSARYDAEGEVGIINIVLKKDEKKGFNGSIEVVGGYPELFRTSFNLNYRREKYNLFTSYGVGYRKSPGGGESYQRFNSPDTNYIYESKHDRERGGLSNNLRLGVDWFLNKKNTITVSGFYRYSDQDNTAKYIYKDLYANRELFREIRRNDFEDETGKSYQSSINYRKTFDKKQQLLTIDLQASQSDDLEESKIEEHNSLSNSVLNQKASNTEFNRNYLLQADYVHPINKKGKLETGFRSNFRTLKNDYTVWFKDTNDIYQIDFRYFNDFIYNENISAAYAMFGNEWKKFSYQIGLRLEHSIINTELTRTNEKNNWEYTNLFPSAHFTYKHKDENSFQLSYSRRINRPRFRHLLPFQTFSDSRNLWRGNPNLQPEFTDSYELGYLYYFEKGTLFSSTYYRYRTSVINRVRVYDQLGFTSMFPINLATQHNIGIEVNGMYKFSKKSSLNGNFNFYRSMMEGSYQGLNLSNNNFRWMSRFIFKKKFNKSLSMQTSLMYRAPRKLAQEKIKSLYSWDFSIAKDILKGKATVVVNCRDILNSRKKRSTIESGYLYNEYDFQWRSRQLTLSFTYRINQKKNRRNSGMSREGSGEDF